MANMAIQKEHMHKLLYLLDNEKLKIKVPT